MPARPVRQPAANPGSLRTKCAASCLSVLTLRFQSMGAVGVDLVPTIVFFDSIGARFPPRSRAIPGGRPTRRGNRCQLRVSAFRSMSQYRYRTSTLVGPWRDTRAEAETDAVAAGQARYQGRWQAFTWLVVGRIEESAPAE